MLPEEIKVLIATGIGLLVTQGLKKLSEWMGADLSGNGAKIAAALTTAIVYFAESLLALVPEQYRPIVSAVFGVVVAIFSAYGLYEFLKGRKALG